MISGERPNGEGAAGWLLSIDFGTTATAAVTVTGGQVSPLALDGAGRMSSSVYSAPPEAVLKVGRQADHEAGYALDRFEPTPKRKIGKPVVRLGGTSYTPAELIAAIFRRVLTEAVLQHNKAAPARVVLTHPVRWPPDQVAILAAAAHSAARDSGVVLPDPEFVAEPVAAAQWYARDNHHEPLHPGQRIAVYDLGGGTFDTTVLERTADGYEVLAKGGIDRLGGYDFDYRLFTHLGDRHIGPANPGLWAALQIPNPDDVDAGWKRRQMQDSVQLLKEQLSDRTSEHTHLPGASGTVLVTRSEFEGLIDDDVDRTIEELADTMAEAGLTPKDLTAIYRIGGASRTPLVGQRLEALHVPVRTLDDPKLVVALGASVTPAVQPSLPPPPKPEPPAEPVGAGATPAEPPQHAAAAHAFAAQPDNTAIADTTTTDQPEKDQPSRKGGGGLGRWGWRSVVIGTVLLTVVTAAWHAWLVYDFLPTPAPWLVLGVCAVVGALSVRIGSLMSGGAGRGWVLAGIMLISAPIAMVLFYLVVYSDFWSQDTFNVFLAVSVGLSALGLVLVLVPQWRHVPSRGAVVGLTAGGALVIAAGVTSIIVARQEFGSTGPERPQLMTVVTGTALILGGLFARTRRRRLVASADAPPREPADTSAAGQGRRSSRRR